MLDGPPDEKGHQLAGSHWMILGVPSFDRHEPEWLVPGQILSAKDELST